MVPGGKGDQSPGKPTGEKVNKWNQGRTGSQGKSWPFALSSMCVYSVGLVHTAHWDPIPQTNPSTPWGGCTGRGPAVQSKGAEVGRQKPCSGKKGQKWARLQIHFSWIHLKVQQSSLRNQGGLTSGFCNGLGIQ